MERGAAKRVSFTEPQSAVAGLAKSRRIRKNGLEHRLQVAWRTADNAKDLGGRRLPLQRFAQFAAARFEFALAAAPPGSQQANKALPHSVTSPGPLGGELTHSRAPHRGTPGWQLVCA